MLELSRSRLRAAEERVNQLREQAAGRAVARAVLADKRRRAREKALAAVRAELAELEQRAANAWRLQRHSHRSGGV
jgi:hypothetical protein